MKPLSSKILITFLVFLLFSSTLAALEVEYKGDFRTRGVFVHNKDLDKSTSGKVALVDTRLRLWLNPKLDETLKLVFGIEIGDISWGEEVGSFTLDNNLGKSSGGAQGTDGVNIETKHIYMQYKPKEDIRLRIGLMPFAAPSQMVVDSDAAAISFRWEMLGLRWTALYARAFAGPRGDGKMLAETNQLVPKDGDSINLNDDRNDYFLSAEYKKGKLSITGWALFDDNNRYKDEVPSNTFLPGNITSITSDLFYLGGQIRSKGKPLSYEVNAVLNTGRITAIQTNRGSVTVLAWALHARASYAFSKTTAVGINLRSISGNSSSDTNPKDTVKQFQVLDATDGDNGSLLSLLFGGGVFNHQSYFYHKTASARLFNATTGYFIRNDPGITSFETYLEQKLFKKKLRIRLIVGYAMTTKALASGKRSLGVETDLALRYRANEYLAFYLTGAFLLPGKALAQTIALDNGPLDSEDERNYGEDPAFKIEAMARVRF